MSDRTPDTARLDAAYRDSPFPGVAVWSRLDASTRLSDALAAWDIARAGLDARSASAEALRAAAWDSGAIEGLYRTDEGVTRTIAQQHAHWEAVARDAGPDAEAHLAANIAGFERVFDVATGSRPLTAPLIRELHATVCEPQQTYDVWTAAGVQAQALPKGVYKTSPNHVISRTGTPFSYAPVEDVQQEVQRFVDDANSDSFRQMSTDLQASWLHYALVRIHPFADGNGRVVRALASLPSWRDASFPLVIPQAERARYIAALAAADSGEHQAFVTFVARNLIRTAEDVTTAARSGPRNGIPPRAGYRPGIPMEQAEAAALLLDRHLMVCHDEVTRDTGVGVVAAPRDALELEPTFRHVRSDIAQVVPGYRFQLRDAPPTTSDRLAIVGLARPAPDADFALINNAGDVLATFVVDEADDATDRLRSHVEAALRRFLSLPS